MINSHVLSSHSVTKFWVSEKISQKFEDIGSSSEDDSESYDSLLSANSLDPNELEGLNNDMVYGF